MYAVHTPLALWIRNGQVLIRDIIRSGIAIHTPYAPHVRHPCVIDTQLKRNTCEIVAPCSTKPSRRSYCVSVHFLVRRTSAMASPASGTGALSHCPIRDVKVATEPRRWKFDTGSVTAWCCQTLSEPMLSQIYVAMWRHRCNLRIMI